MDLNALLWDVDGTLADTEDAGHRRAFNAAFRAAGLPWQWESSTYRELLRVSGGRERMRHFAVHSQGHVLSDDQVEALMDAKQRAYASLARRGELPLRPGVLRLVAEVAARGTPQALVTTSSRSAVAALLEGHGEPLASAFAFWICGEDVDAKKPSPQAYVQALRRLELPPSQVVAIEDSPQGLAAAKGAALPCLITLGDSPPDDTEAWWGAATATVDHLGEAGRSTRVWRGPDCAEGRITAAWLAGLLEAA
ncbi:MAG: HAD-IA family hydrolase [Cyanobacteriota bacterium]